MHMRWILLINYRISLFIIHLMMCCDVLVMNMRGLGWQYYALIEVVVRMRIINYPS